MSVIEKIKIGIYAFRAETNTEPVGLSVSSLLVSIFDETDISELHALVMPNPVLGEVKDEESAIFVLENSKYKIKFSLV